MPSSASNSLALANYLSLLDVTITPDCLRLGDLEAQERHTASFFDQIDISFFTPRRSMRANHAVRPAQGNVLACMSPSDSGAWSMPTLWEANILRQNALEEATQRAITSS